MKNRFTCLYLFLLVFTLYSCKPDINETQDKGLKNKAQSILVAKMAPSNYNDLNWASVQKFTENTKEVLIIIPLKSNPEKKLFFTKNNDSYNYNFAEISNKKEELGNSSFTLILTDINNNLLNTHLISNNKIEKINTKTKESSNSTSQIKSLGFGDDAVELPDVIVSSKLGNITTNYLSLYWMMNGNGLFISRYIQEKSGDGAVVANDAVSGERYFYSGKVSTMPNGNKSVIFNCKDAFAFSGLEITFEFDLSNLIPSSVNSIPLGAGSFSPFSLFVGTWSQLKVTDIYTDGNKINFTILAKNTGTIGFINIGGRYTAYIEFNILNNDCIVSFG